MDWKNKTIKLISAVLILSALAPSVLLLQPEKTEAFWFSTWVTDVNTGITASSTGIGTGATVGDLGYTIKNFAKDLFKQVLMSMARRALQEMTKSTINWINSGFHGNPLFVENPQSFFKDIAKTEVKNFIDLTGYDSLRFPFGRDFALNTIGAYKRQLSENAEYSLSRVINDPALLESYRSDFYVGGWNGFLINTQYPQNNYIGYQMLATDALARKVAGTSQNVAEKVNATLQQGMGFLSPQTCPSNPLYPQGTNPYNSPSFNSAEFTKENPFNPPQLSDYGGDYQRYVKEYQAYDQSYTAKLEGAKDSWSVKYSCPGGFVNTTPGTLVANQISTSMSSVVRNKELAAAMGNSISAILDTMLNKFIGDGLNALATKVNPRPNDPDDWDYYGNTLGTVSPYGITPWDAGPEEEIVLDKFKEEVATGIANTTLELKFMYNESAAEPGILQMLGAIWPKARLLDICIPGPDRGWQDRLFAEMDRASKPLQEKLSDDDGEKSAKADLAFKELKFAVNFFEDWISNKMMVELPNSIMYMDAVSEIDDLSQQAEQLTGRRRTKMQTLGRLQSIQGNLNKMTSQPLPDTGDEELLIALRKQYTATRDSIANMASIEDTRNQLEIAKEQDKKLAALLPQCETQRKAKGWSVPGGWNSKFTPGSGTQAAQGGPVGAQAGFTGGGSTNSLAGASASAVSGSSLFAGTTTIGLSGKAFTLNGQAKFLVLAGYFDGLDSADPAGDMAYLKSKGFDGVRIFPNWWNWAQMDNGDAKYSNSTLLTSSGGVRPERLAKLKQIIEAAAREGMVVDISFARETVNGSCSNRGRGTTYPMLCEAQYKNGVVSVATSLKDYTNIFYDLQNEFDGDITALSASHVTDLKNRIKAADPNVIVSLSTADPNGTTAKNVAQTYGMDIINAHFAGGAELNSNLSSALGAKPVYNGEPYHTDSLEDGTYGAQDLINGAKRSKQTGYAAWTFHTADTFTIDGSTVQGVLGAEEKGFVNGFKAAVDATAWGVTGTPSTPPPGGRKITSVSPLSGPVGTTVKFIGTGLEPTINYVGPGISGTVTATVNSAGTEVTAVVPGDAPEGAYTITIGSATTGLSNAVKFTVGNATGGQPGPTPPPPSTGNALYCSQYLSSPTKPACGCYIGTGTGRGTKWQTVKNAMNAVIAADSSWQNSTDITGFKDAVVAYLNSRGEVAARGNNGNCNKSANNLAIQISGGMAEMYEIARDGAGCNDEVPATVGNATSCRPLDAYVGTWSFVGQGIQSGGSCSAICSGATTAPGVAGTEMDLFCNFPIKGGYTHESFKGPDTTVPKLPMVNAKDVMNWKRWGGIFGTRRVNIEMRCNLIYKATVLDYKGKIPGLTTVIEPYEELPTDVPEEEEETGGCGAGIRILAEEGPPPSYENDVQSIARATVSENPGLASEPRENEQAGEQLVDLIVARLRAAGYRAGAAINCNGVRRFDENIIVGKAGTTVDGRDLGEFYSLFRVEDGISYQEASDKRSGGMFVEYADYPRCEEQGC